MITLKSLTGEIFIVQTELQASAFEGNGYVRVEEEVKPTKTKKEQE